MNRLGKAQPLKDSLHVLTLAGASPAAGAGGGVVPGAVYENKITLWQESGDLLYQFEADQAGLVDAISTAHDGSTIVLPSQQIDMTASFTIPVGVTLIGLSRENAILSFTTLSNEGAIMLSARSAIEHLTVTVAGTEPLIGIDARAAKAVVREVTVNMASHATNTCIYAGYAESA